MKKFWHADKNGSFNYKLITSTQNKKFAYLSDISRKMWVIKLIFCL